MFRRGKQEMIHVEGLTNNLPFRAVVIFNLPGGFRISPAVKVAPVKGIITQAYIAFLIDHRAGPFCTTLNATVAGSVCHGPIRSYTYFRIVRG